jgi:hypothetical protein
MFTSCSFQNKRLEEENAMLKQHTSTLTHENQQLEQQLKASTVHQSDSLQALLKETLLQEPFAQGSAVPPHIVSPQQKQFLMKRLFLQIVLALK